ncbi:FmdB family transcriptional regulator [Microbacterium sp. CFBP 8790]|uniref:FmdB family zinc ribbon protein n=1 Tax=unclassified Microbacterium TaxID=2609290 RepID=UPI00177BF793|nr:MULTISPECIES: FmdB family zinc ribbon protein [unclassified Microbacterium]MBD8206121.1 FmdB family transcriptional regulator [Microbacterium sp. CFBP 8801]MBD8510488.1 FmdB family transcriptional regulator [Microbacterium sp. CFBP 8790]
MPTYAYACKQCGHRFETVQSFSDAALTECPECGGEVRKQYGSIGVTFNGSGFYRTDSRNSSSSSSSSSGASAGGASSSSTSSKAQSKPSAPSSAS